MTVVMGRPKTQFRDLPQRLFARERRGKVLYYYRGAGKYLPLGSDRAVALRRWFEIEQAATATPGSFQEVAERYREEVLPTKAPKTQYEQKPQLTRLIGVFGHMPVSAIEPQHVRQYLDARGKTAKVMANREVALLSHVYNFARQIGACDRANPVQGVTKHKEKPREVYVTDEMFAAVYERADGALQDAMDLALLIGQRVADLIGARRSDVKDGFLQVRQRKTGKPLRFEVTPELQRIIARATGRTREAAGVYILADSKGRPLTYWALRRRFDAAREAAGKENAELAAWQFRDLRAKTASDSESLDAAQSRLGHTSSSTTRRVYRRGEKVRPLR